MTRAVEAAVGAAKQAGLEVVELTPPMAVEAAQTWGKMLSAEVEVMMLDAIRKYGSREVNGVIDDLLEVFPAPDLAGFMAAQAQRLAVLRKWGQMFDRVDALILPVSGQPPFRADQDIVSPETGREIIEAQRFLYIINGLGLPGATVRTLDSTPVPLGVQIVGDRMDDVVCLDVAAAIERELALDLRPIDPR